MGDEPLGPVLSIHGMQIWSTQLQPERLGHFTPQMDPLVFTPTASSLSRSAIF
jgi:hypothetical protein